jgi:hypothetical protein
MAMTNSRGEFAGFNLGFDFCAEHEYGIKTIKQRFDILTDDIANSKILGIDRYSIRQANEILFFTGKVDGEKAALLLWCDEMRWRKPVSNLKDALKEYNVGTFGLQAKEFDKEVKYEDRKERRIHTQWSERGFAILVIGKDYIEYLEQLRAAFASLDVAFGVQASKNPFDRGGLTILIKSRVDEEFKKAQYDADLAEQQLQLAAKPWFEKYAALPTSHKNYSGQPCNEPWHALSPSFEKDGALMFWLNPRDQKKYAFGWYTPKQIQEYIVTGVGAPFKGQE